MNKEAALPRPLVSVCIPTHNRAMKLKRAVEELMKCSYQNLEIIIADNASPDQTNSVCAELAGLDDRVRYCRHAENIGPTKNFMFVNRQAKGKYFMWLSDDDYLDPDYIQTCVEALEREPSLVLVAGLGAYYRDGRLSYHGNVVQPNSASPLLRVITYLWSTGESSILYGVYRLDRTGACQMPNCLAGDWIWVADVLLKGAARVIPVTYVNREFGDSMSSTFKRYAAIIDAPAWHGNFPLVAISQNVAKYIAFEAEEYRRAPMPKKIGIYLILIILMFLKFSLAKVRIVTSTLPFARKIYRRFFKPRMVS